MSSSFTPKTTTNLARSAPDTLGVADHPPGTYLDSIYVLFNYLENKLTLVRLFKVIPFESFRHNVIHSH
jgi:hypothetical protein